MATGEQPSPPHYPVGPENLTNSGREQCLLFSSARPRAGPGSSHQWEILTPLGPGANTVSIFRSESEDQTVLAFLREGRRGGRGKFSRPTPSAAVRSGWGIALPRQPAFPVPQSPPHCNAPAQPLGEPLGP